MTWKLPNTLAFHIAIVLIIKLTFIWGLWYAFFSQPLDDHLTDHAVSSVLLETPHHPTKTEAN